MLINPVLETHNAHHIERNIGSVHWGSKTLADLITIASFDSEELRMMLDIQNHYLCTERHISNHTKSQVNQLSKVKSDADHYFNGLRLTNTRSFKHLWILDDSNTTHCAGKLIKRKSVHLESAILHDDAGFYGMKGLNSKNLFTTD